MRPIRMSPFFFLTFTGMELSYLYLLAALFNWPVYILILSLFLYPMALLFNQTAAVSSFSQRLKYIVEIVLFVVIILLVAGERLSSSLSAGHTDVPGIIFCMFFCGFTWLMGHTAGNNNINYFSIALRLQAGLLTILILSQITGNAAAVFIFFLLAPSVLFYGRWSHSVSRGAVALDSPNMMHFFLGGANIIVPGTALILLFSPDVARAIVRWLARMFNAFSDWTMAQHQITSNQTGASRFNLSCNIRPEASGMPYPDSMPPTSSGGDAGINTIIIWIIVAVVLLAILALIVFIIKKRKPGSKDPVMEPVQFKISKISLNPLRDLLIFFLWLFWKIWDTVKSLFRKWKRHNTPPEEVFVSVRDIYRNLLSWAAKNGIARVASQTPLEHLHALVKKFPGQQESLTMVIDAYLLVRYSQKLIPRDEFFRIKEIWQTTVAGLADSRDGN